MFWEKKGKVNTVATVALAVEKAKAENINTIVVASTTGETAKLLVEQHLNVVCVTHQIGYAKPGVDEMSQENRDYLVSKGVKLYSGTHLFAGVDRALRFKFQGVYPGEIVSTTLRMFGQGVKVAIEVAVMALDAGLIPYAEDIIAIGGTGTGADAAIIIQPAHSQNIFDSKIKEIICMPKQK